MSAVRILEEELESPDFDFNPLEQALHAWEIRRSDPKESHRIALDLIDHALEFDEPAVTGWAYLTCGAHELAANELDQAEETLESANRLFSRIGERRGESLSLIARARLLMTRGDFRRALELYKSIIEREAHGLSTLEKFEAFNSIAGCFWGLDKIDVCLLYLSKAFDILKNTSYHTERATVLGNIGSALISVGNHKAAYEFLTAAIGTTDALLDRYTAYTAHSSLVACLLELNDVEKAFAMSAKLVRDYQDLMFASPNNVAWCSVAAAFARAKQFGMAEQCLLAAKKMAEESGVRTSLILAAQAEAAVAESRGNFAVAIAHAEACLDNFGTEVPEELRAQLYALLASCYQQLGAQKEVFRYKKQKLDLSEKRYQTGLTAAMVILDLQSNLKSSSRPVA